MRWQCSLVTEPDRVDWAYLPGSSSKLGWLKSMSSLVFLFFLFSLGHSGGKTISRKICWRRRTVRIMMPLYPCTLSVFALFIKLKLTWNFNKWIKHIVCTTTIHEAKWSVYYPGGRMNAASGKQLRFSMTNEVICDDKLYAKLVQCIIKYQWSTFCWMWGLIKTFFKLETAFPPKIQSKRID